MERIPYGVAYIKYKDLDQPAIIKERASWNLEPLDDWTVDNLNEDVKNGYIEVLEALTRKQALIKLKEEGK